MTEYASTMFITRTFNNEEEIEIEVEIFGTLCRAEPDIGIMSDYFEDIFAINPETKKVIKLTEKELERANEILCEDYSCNYYD